MEGGTPGKFVSLTLFPQNIFYSRYRLNNKLFLILRRLFLIKYFYNWYATQTESSYSLIHLYKHCHYRFFIIIFYCYYLLQQDNYPALALIKTFFFT